MKPRENFNLKEGNVICQEPYQFEVCLFVCLFFLQVAQMYKYGIGEDYIFDQLIVYFSFSKRFSCVMYKF